MHHGLKGTRVSEYDEGKRSLPAEKRRPPSPGMGRAAQGHRGAAAGAGAPPDSETVTVISDSPATPPVTS